MDTVIVDSVSINPELLLYNHMEFFFSKADLKTMMTIKPLSYEPWLDTLYDLYSTKPEKNDKSFHYNIKHTKEYETISNKLKEIEKITKGIDEHASKSDEIRKNEIKACIKEIESQYPKLYYYDEIYMYAHYIFNNIRNSGVLQMGGGITLEEFKEKIREKIKQLGL
jgi:hypothetical protein